MLWVSGERAGRGGGGADSGGGAVYRERWFSADVNGGEDGKRYVGEWYEHMYYRTRPINIRFKHRLRCQEGAPHS